MDSNYTLCRLIIVATQQLLYVGTLYVQYRAQQMGIKKPNGQKHNTAFIYLSVILM